MMSSRVRGSGVKRGEGSDLRSGNGEWCEEE